MFALLVSVSLLVQKTLGGSEFSMDQTSRVPQIIRRHGYRVESHIIVTSDGYMLTLIRIPGSKDGQTNNQPVLLQHGAMADSSSFILNGNNSLGNYV